MGGYLRGLGTVPSKILGGGWPMHPSPQSEHVLRKIHHCTFGPKIPHFVSHKFWRPFFLVITHLYGLGALYREIISFTTFFFKLYPENVQLHRPKNLMTFLLVIAPFWTVFYTFLLTQMITPISYPSIPAHIIYYIYCFFTFLHLALCSRNNKYFIRHLFILNSSLHKQPFITAHFLSSLHILCITAH